MTTLEQAIQKRGYARCPNNPGRWYAGAPGILEPECGFDVYVRETHIEILPAWWKSSRPVAIATFYRIEDLFTWLAVHGRISEPGYRQPYWID